MIKMLAHVMEMIVFIFLGISSITNDHIWNWPFVFFTILFCSVFREATSLIMSQIQGVKSR